MTPMKSMHTRGHALVALLVAGAPLAAGLGCSDGMSMVTDAAAPDAGAVDAGPVSLGGVVAAGVRWFGRVDTATDPAQPRFSWSGTGFVARFSGTSLTMQLGIGGAIEIFKTVVDGAPQPAFTVTGSQPMYSLATGLTAGVHTVEVYRQTEGPQGQTQLQGLTVGDGALMDPPEGPYRLIELIGDSITCGYGDLGTLADTECYTTESHWDTYESVAARALGAEVSTIAASGRGVIRNYGDDVVNPTMPMLYGRTVANAAGTPWDFHIQPQAVVVNLGTNDISTHKDPGDAFRDTYATLLQTIRTNYPDAYIIGLIGPLLSGADLAVIQGHIRDAVDVRIAAGDTKVEYFSAIAAQTTDKFACQYHPNVAENQLMGDQLAAELKSKLGW